MKNIDLIKKIKIRDIISNEDINIIDTTSGWKSLCPFHDEKTPSFTVIENEEADLYYCHGCKVGGDIVEFVKRYYNKDFTGAYEYLSNFIGLDSDMNNNIQNKFVEIDKILIKEHSYFNEKKLTMETINHFGVGYIDDISKYSEAMKTILADGIENIRNAVYYPIKDLNNNTVGFYFRNLSQGSNVKYIGNSKVQLFGLQNIEKCKHVIVVEGHNDVLKLYQAGIKNVIGVCGTNFNKQIFEYLSGLGITTIYYIPDNDGGGYKFIDNIITKYGTFDTYNISVRVLQIPTSFNGKNPCDYIDIDYDFFNKPHINSISPIKSYYERIYNKYQFDIERISDILENKPYINKYEVQIILSEILNIDNLILDVENGSTLNDKNAEEIILCNMLKDIVILNNNINILTAEHFTIPEYKNIFSFIVEHKTLDQTTIKEKFSILLKKSDVVGNDIYVKRLIELKKKRDLYKILSKYNMSTISKNSDTTPIISSIVNDMTKLTKDTNMFKSRTSDIVLLSAIKNINISKYDGIHIDDKFPILSKILRGLCPGRFTIVGANSGVGKTSFACNIADSVAYVKNRKGIFFTNEMTDEELMLRQISIHLDISYNAMIDKQINFDRYADKLKEMSNKNLIFSTLPNIDELELKVKSLILKHGKVDFIILDYLQLMYFSSVELSRMPRYQQLKALTSICKNIAVELNINVIGIAQLNKSGLNNGNIAGVDNIAGAYDMISDADIGIFLTKNETGNEITDGNIIINVDKVRYNGDDVLIKAFYNKSSLRFKEII